MTEIISNIHGHSAFSFNDGVCTPEELVAAAKEKGLKSVALTDHGACHGHADLYLAGRKHQMKVIYGVEAYLINDLNEWNGLRDKLAAEKKATGKLTAADGDDGDGVDLERAKDKESRRLLNRKGHMVMVAQNRKGLSNIYKLTHLAHKVGMYRKPRMDKAMLREHSEGIIASSACMGGIIANAMWALRRGEVEWDEVICEALDYDEIFGRGKFFLELQSNEHESQKIINDGLIKIHEETGIPLIVTMDSHYTSPQDWKTQQILHMLLTHRGMAGGLTMGNLPPDYDFKTKSLFLKSANELRESFARWNPEVPKALLDQAFANTLAADSLIEAFEPDTTQRLPTLPYPDVFKELGERALKGLMSRQLHEDHRYVERLLYELGMIKDKGISSYFLVVNQIVEETRKRQLIGPGRGSAGGSLVCYLLGITNIDPIEHDLMFERFINVDRTEVPDIDLDFQDVDGVKDVLREIFGEDNVACISTFGTSQIKGVMKDVCRVFDIDHGECNKANAKMEKELHAMYEQGEAKSAVIIKLEDVYRLSPTFKEFVAAHPEIEEPIKRMYGKVHHVGRHASGVVIGDDLPRETAVFTSKGVLQTSFTDGVVNKNLSAMGLVKFDILGLATLNIIAAACKIIGERTDRTREDVLKEIDPKNLDMNDQRVMKTVFHDGNMTGVFQCLDSKTLVTMADGTRRRICDVAVDDSVLSRREDGTYGPCVVNSVIDNGEQECIELEFIENEALVKRIKHRVVCTADHKFFTINRGWVKADELECNDDVPGITTKSKFRVKCLECGNEFLTWLANEHGKQQRFRCKSCAIKAAWKDEQYRLNHATAVREANSRPEVKQSHRDAWNKLTVEERLARVMPAVKAAHSPAAIEKLRESLKRNWMLNDPSFRKHPKGYIQQRVTDSFGHERVLSSSWEKRFVDIMNRDGLLWRYEEHRFELNRLKRIFVPDFWCVELDVFFEVKGYMRPDAKEKIDCFREENPDAKLIIVDGDILMRLERGMLIEALI